jgi:hypothetical protein
MCSSDRLTERSSKSSHLQEKTSRRPEALEASYDSELYLPDLQVSDGKSFLKDEFAYGIYVDRQKGFIKKTNGCSQHDILLNELFEDAKRKKKDLIVTAIDLSNAFGFVQHDLIMSTLKQLNFPTPVRAIIKYMYDKAKSTIESRGRQIGSIKSRKGVK